MTSDEAFKQWYETAGKDGVRLDGKDAWDACLEFVKSGQEPFGEIQLEDMGRPFNALQVRVHFYKEVPPVGTKLFAHPAPAQPVRLSEEEVLDAIVGAAHKPYEHIQRLSYDSGPYEVTKLSAAGFKIANAIMDAMLAKGAEQPAVVQQSKAPYAFIYEFNSSSRGIHRSLTDRSWNGMMPTKVFPVWTTPVYSKESADSEPAVVPVVPLKNALEACEVFEKLFRQAEAMHKGLIDGNKVIDCAITVNDLRKGLRAAYELRERQEPAEVQEPVPWMDIVSAVKAVTTEASSRGKMFPQEADKHAEDRSASRRVCELIEWYATCGGSVAEKLEGWPKRYAHPTPAVVQQLVEALWVCMEHNRLHFGDNHNTVIQSQAALKALESTK